MKPATLLKVTLLHGCFSRFLNCTNSTKSRNAPHMSDHYGLTEASKCTIESYSVTISKMF